MATPKVRNGTALKFESVGDHASRCVRAIVADRLQESREVRAGSFFGLRQ